MGLTVLSLSQFPAEGLLDMIMLLSTSSGISTLSRRRPALLTAFYEFLLAPNLIKSWSQVSAIPSLSSFYGFYMPSSGFKLSFVQELRDTRPVSR